MPLTLSYLQQKAVVAQYIHPPGYVYQMPGEFYSTRYHPDDIWLQQQPMVDNVSTQVRIPFCRGEVSYSSFHCTTTFVVISIAPCCLPFLSTFLPLHFLDLSSDNTPILSVVLFVFCNRLISVSQIIYVW